MNDTFNDTFMMILISIHLSIIAMHATCITAKPKHNLNIVSVHFSHFPHMKICNTLRRYLCMLADIYLNMDEC